MLCYLHYLITLLLSVTLVEGSNSPHIIFILADDVGWNDLSFHGSDQIQTPNIDALAYNGVILHQHYVQPICTPTRSALMTGRYPSNLGMQGVPIGGSEPRALPEGKILPQYLKDLEYSTHIVGKWHLGFYKEEFTPTNRGFDSFLGYYNGFIGYYDHIYQEVFDSGSTMEGLDFRRNFTVAWDLTGQYATDVLTEEAERIIRGHDVSTPLFLYLSHLAGHSGNKGSLLEAPQDIINKFSHITEPNRKLYAAMMWKLDESVGRVVKALQDSGMLDNCIIVFLSDNGAPTTNTIGHQNWGSNFPFRGIKGTQWEGALRTPAIIWSPFLEARISYELMHVTDWVPTLFSAAGGKDSQLRNNLDGVDQWNSLLHSRASNRTNMLLEFDEISEVFALRDTKWKLTQGSYLGGIMDEFYGDNGKTSDNPAYNTTAVLNSDVENAISQVSSSVVETEESIRKIRDEATVTCPENTDATPCNSIENEPCLFDLSVDPCETNNVGSLYPEQVQHMMTLLQSHWLTLVNQTNQPADINADPKNFNNVWTPWITA